MSEIIRFPVSNNRQHSEQEEAIDEELKSIPKKDREKLKFELIKTIDSYDGFFTEWSLNLPKDSDELLKKQIYDAAHLEHSRKMLMLKDLIKLKTKILVMEYHQRK